MSEALFGLGIFALLLFHLFPDLLLTRRRVFVSKLATGGFMRTATSDADDVTEVFIVRLPSSPKREAAMYELARNAT